MLQAEPRGASFGDYCPDVDLNNRYSESLERVGNTHDLSNLIQIASSAMSIIDRNSEVGKSAALQSVVASARMALQRAGALLRQNIRPSGRHHNGSGHTSVVGCLAEIEAMIQCTWASNIYLDLQIADDLPMVRCDRLDLQSAILNLALNARDAMPDGGLISIEVCSTYTGSAQATIELRVSDNGVGMTRETAIRACEPFFTTKSGGLGGIGLPMVKRFVEEAGGSINIESEFGFGTTVSLQVPAFR